MTQRHLSPSFGLQNGGAEPSPSSGLPERSSTLCRMRRWTPRLLVLLVVTAVGCGPRLIEEPVHTTKLVRVVLRRTLEGGEPVSRGYDHPVLIAGVRLAHILGSLSYEDSKGKRKPVIRTTHIYDVAEGLATGLERAGADDEVAAAAFARDRQLVLFTQDRVTSFRLWVQEEQLYLEFFTIEEILDAPGVSDDVAAYRIPKSRPGVKREFRLLPGDAIAAAGPGVLAVDWRDPRFREPVGLSVHGSGIRRSTVLMETPAEEELPKPPAPEGLTDAQVRALDELEAARRSGLITELEFQRRRRLILEDELEKAGYGTGPR